MHGWRQDCDGGWRSRQSWRDGFRASSRWGGDGWGDGWSDWSGGSGHWGRRGGGGRARFFDHGALRFIILSLIAEWPRNGYEIIKGIEERSGGRYAPSPGVVYPTLKLMEEQGWIEEAVAENGKKRFAITEDGVAALAANQRVVDQFNAMAGEEGESAATGDERADLKRAMTRLFASLRARMARGGDADAKINSIVAALDAASEAIERS